MRLKDRTGEERINNLFTKRDNTRGNSPIGTTPNSSGNYVAQCCDGNGKKFH